MRASGVVVLAPALDDDPGLGEAVEDFAIEQLVPQLRVEALAASLDRTSVTADRWLRHGPIGRRMVRQDVFRDVSGCFLMLPVHDTASFSSSLWRAQAMASESDEAW